MTQVCWNIDLPEPGIEPGRVSSGDFKRDWFGTGLQQPSALSST